MGKGHVGKLHPSDIEKEEEIELLEDDIKEPDYYVVQLSCLQCNYEFTSKVRKGVELQYDKMSGFLFYYANYEEEIEGLKSYIECPGCETDSKIVKGE